MKNKLLIFFSLALLSLAFVAAQPLTPSLAEAIKSCNLLLILNGNFENPKIDQGYVTFYEGQNIGEWQVSSGSVDLLGHVSQSGHQAVDMSGFDAGTIYQDIPMRIGNTCTLSFWVHGEENEIEKHLRVEFDNKILADDLTVPMNGPWYHHTFKVRTTTNNTRLIFESLTPGVDGMYIDNVQLSCC